MARVAIVSYDIQTIRGKAGGVGAFTTRWANLLRKAGDDVTLVMTRIDREPMTVDLPWRARYQANEIGLIELQAPPRVPTRMPEVPTVRVSELAAPVLRNFDIVYLQDWGNAGLQLLRERRYQLDQGPVCVTVLHGPSEWELSSNETYPRLPDDLHLAYQERYAARQSDYVISPSHYMVRHLAGLGWQFPGEVEVLGLPMPLEQAGPVTSGSTVAPHIKKIVCFARIEERKGIRLFVKAMQQFAKQSSTRPEVVLLGAVRDPKLLEYARSALKSAGYAVTHLDAHDSEQAVRYLREHAPETLCVVPSPADNFPYTVIEASLVPGLNLIACRGGGVTEILSDAAGQMCEPLPRELAAKVGERLQTPLEASALAQYDCVAAEQRWLGFHAHALASAAKRSPRQLPPERLSVDVCATYFQKAAYMAQFVDALEHQTEQDFHVIAVDDGSADEESKRVFAEQAERGTKHGWDFFSQENTFVDVARNRAAARGQGELILFIDSDDVPAKNAVARMREAMTLSGDDALICSSFFFASNRAPYDLTTGAATVSAYATSIPLGLDLVGGLINPVAFGSSMFMVRRSAFEAIGGFTEKRGAGHEDWELYVRLALAGYKVDVLPDMLHFYRQVEGGLARTLSSEASRRRLLSAYEESMSAAGLAGGALALWGLYQRNKELEGRIRMLTTHARAPQSGYAYFSGAGRRFEPEPRRLSVRRLQSWYRSALPLETRLKIHRIFLAPFVGPYEPPTT